MWSSPFDFVGQSVWTVLATLAALSELANVRKQAHLVMKGALCETPAQAVKNVKVPGVARRVRMCVLASDERVARFVFVAQDSSPGHVFLQAALQSSNKAGKASPMHRSAWPGRCASAGGGSGR